MKKSLTILLAVLLLFSICTTGVLADDETDETTVEAENTVSNQVESVSTQDVDVADKGNNAEPSEQDNMEDELLQDVEVDTAFATDESYIEVEESESEDSESSSDDVLEISGEETTTLGEDAEPTSLVVTYINPLYADVLTEDDLVKPVEGPSTALIVSDYATSLSDAAVQMREGLVSRETTITVQYTSTGFTQELVTEEGSSIYNLALEHTGVSTEGDYLRWQLGGWTATYYQDSKQGDVYYISAVYTITYYTTAAQEEELSTALTAVLSSMDLESKDEVEKLDAIYQFICENVSYDYANVNDSSYKLQFTAYAALINGTAVCQGYCVLFYRMTLEAGLDARIISGNSSSHGWNIVKLGDYYYNVDATWDAANYSYGSYYYFLRCDANFYSHTRDSSYSTTDFYETYPMSDSDYPCPYGHSYISVVTDPTCTEGGYTTYTCSVCGNTYTDNETDALGHSYVSEITKEATESVAGIITYTCTSCGDSYTETYTLYKSGDVNGDGDVDILDVIRLLRYVNGEEVEVIEGSTDVNNDGEEDIIDVIRLLKYVNEEIESL